MSFFFAMTENMMENSWLETAPKATRVDDPEALMQAICRAADEMKARDIVVLDVRGQTIIADYFVLCAGTSTTHIQAIAGNVQDNMRENGFRSRPEGGAESFWVVMDYGDAILHVLSEETREFYDLERLWGEAKISHWPTDPASK